jgi:Fic family protein
MIEMKECERQIQTTEKGMMPRATDTSQRIVGTDLRLSQLRADLRLGWVEEEQTIEQRAVLEQIEAALEAYRSFSYPPASSQ